MGQLTIFTPHDPGVEGEPRVMAGVDIDPLVEELLSEAANTMKEAKELATERDGYRTQGDSMGHMVSKLRAELEVGDMYANGSQTCRA